MNDAPQAIDAPTVFGTPYAGGFYGGRIYVAGAVAALVFAPRAEGQINLPLLEDYRKRVEGALSYIDGLANTNAFAEAGSKLAKWARDLRIGGGTDWYVPSRLESLVLCCERQASGDKRFFPDGEEAFDAAWYWTSSQDADDASYAWIQSFRLGTQYHYHKGLDYRARAVRRVILK